MEQGSVPWRSTTGGGNGLPAALAQLLIGFDFLHLHKFIVDFNIKICIILYINYGNEGVSKVLTKKLPKHKWRCAGFVIRITQFDSGRELKL